MSTGNSSLVGSGAYAGYNTPVPGSPIQVRGNGLPASWYSNQQIPSKPTSLVVAAYRSDGEGLAEAIEAGNINAVDAQGNTALIHAVNSNNANTFLKLFHAGGSRIDANTLEKIALSAANQGADQIMKVITTVEKLLDPQSRLAQRALAIINYRTQEPRNLYRSAIETRLKAENRTKDPISADDISKAIPQGEEIDLASKLKHWEDMAKNLSKYGVREVSMNEEQMWFGAR